MVLNHQIGVRFPVPLPHLFQSIRILGLTLILSIAAVLRAILRAPLVPVRELIRTPAAYWPAFSLAGLATFAWFRRPRWRDGRTDAATEAMGCVVAAAAVLWFFQFGRFPWRQEQDWVRNWTYFSSLRDAMLQGRIPYDLRSAFFGADWYWANPETLLVPYVVLLRGMSISSFFTLHILVCVGGGLWGLIALRRELALSPIVWVVFLTIFFFNGHITAHLSVGHLQWVAYYLLPWVFVSLTRAARHDCSTRNAAVLALTLAAMVMLGGWHVFIWSLLFTIFLCLPSRARLVFLARTLVVTTLLAAFRLLPTAVMFHGTSNVFALSFRSARMLIDALVVGQTARFAAEHEGWWEFDTYIGVVGFALLCLGAVPWRTAATKFLNAFYLPALALFVLSIGGVYEATLFRLPGFVSERVVTRLAIVPALALVLAGCVRVDRWLARAMSRWSIRGVGSLLAAYFLIAQVVLVAAGWRPVGGGPPPPFNSVFRPGTDRLDFWTVWIGSAVSIATLIAVTFIFRAPRVEIPGRPVPENTYGWDRRRAIP